MKGFSLALALVDFIPVLAFGVAIVLVAGIFGSPLFVIGAVCSLVAGCCKVLWKLILALKGKDVKWLNKMFLPMQAGGWLVMLAALVLNMGKIKWASVWAAVSGMPQALFFIAWIAAMYAMVWYKKNRFERYSAKANWTAEIINSLGQTAFLLAVIFCR